jgi:hypothetical protein
MIAPMSHGAIIQSCVNAIFQTISFVSQLITTTMMMMMILAEITLPDRRLSDCSLIRIFK